MKSNRSCSECRAQAPLLRIRERSAPRPLRTLLLILLLAVTGGRSASADPPAGYYDSVDTSSPETLRASLHEIIKDHTRYPYTSTSTDTWDILVEADQDPLDSSHILDVYRNRSFVIGHADYNREHVWPKSYGLPNEGDLPHTDCHHLFLCDSGVNNARDRRHFDYCSEGSTEYYTYLYNGEGGGTGVYPGNSNWACDGGPAGIWEVWIGRRGDVARAMLYLDVRYEGGQHGVLGWDEPDLVLTDNPGLIGTMITVGDDEVWYIGMLSVLKQWHLEDPVDDKERRRNDVRVQLPGQPQPVHRPSGMGGRPLHAREQTELGFNEGPV